MIVLMTFLNLTNSEPASTTSGSSLTGDSPESAHPVLRALSLASLVIGATAIGLYIGRELRLRYKFNRRTPYDFYSKAGDPVTMTEYGMGI
jgi:hypothetical protein